MPMIKVPDKDETVLKKKQNRIFLFFMHDFSIF